MTISARVMPQASAVRPGRRQAASGPEADRSSHHQSVRAASNLAGSWFSRRRAGRIRTDIPAPELMAMVISLAISWNTATWSLEALQPENRRRTSADHKAAVVSAVTALVQPRTQP
ncbi:hypothetical protein [Streptomyces sp. NPDC000878]